MVETLLIRLWCAQDRVGGTREQTIAMTKTEQDYYAESFESFVFYIYFVLFLRLAPLSMSPRGSMAYDML